MPTGTISLCRRRVAAQPRQQAVLGRRGVAGVSGAFMEGIRKRASGSSGLVAGRHPPRVYTGGLRDALAAGTRARRPRSPTLSRALGAAAARLLSRSVLSGMRPS